MDENHFEARVKEEAKQRISDLQRKANQQGEEAHRFAAMLAGRVANYYRELTRRGVPESLAYQLVTAYHDQQLATLRSAQFIVYVPALSSEG